MRIIKRFSIPSLDTNGLEKFREISWQRQLHLFEVPFYYIEYGIAQLGAIGMWKQYRDNPAEALKNYTNALSLGGTKTLPELYAAAGLPFDFSPGTIRSLMEMIERELDQLG
jgi:oligoendopeptidase F